MKKALFILFVSLIGFGAKTYSQTTVSLDSIVDKITSFAYTRSIIFYSSLQDSTPSQVIEKGIVFKPLVPLLLTDRIQYPDSIVNHFELDSPIIFFPIINTEFDTILHFVFIDNIVYTNAYVITASNDTIYGDSTHVFYLNHVGLEDIANTNLEIKLFPTIIDKEVNINSDKYPISLSIIDLFGKEILQKQIFNPTSLDLGFLEKGIYISRFRYKDNIITRKIIKN